MTAEVDVNGGGEVSVSVSVPPKDLPNGNANADGGLVFVNGNGNVEPNDAVSSDAIKTDLNSGSSVVESEVDNDQAVRESQESVSDEVAESSVIVIDGEVDRENGVLDSSNGVGENPNSGVDSELVVIESASDDQPQHSNVVDGDQCTPLEIKPQPVEIAERVPSLIHDSADLPVESACENENEAPDLTKEIPTEEVKIDLEESGLCPEGDVELESQVVGGPAGSGLDAGHTQDVVPENVDAGQEETPELGDTSETAVKTLPSPPVVSENAPIENGQSAADAAVIITTAELGDSSEIITQSLASPVIENVSIKNDRSVPTAPVAEPVEPDAGPEASTDADVKKEHEFEKTKMGSGSDSHLVDNVKVDIQVENGPAGDTVSSGGRNDDAGSEIGTGVNSNVSEDSTVESNVPEGVADVENGPVGDDTVSIGLNKDAGSEIESALVEKVSATDDDINMEPQVPEGVVENGPVNNDLNNDLRSETEAMSEEKVSTSPSVVETKVPEEDSNMDTKVPEEDSNMDTRVSEEDSSTETKVPEEDASTETKVPEEDARTETKGPEKDASTESKGPEKDTSTETKVPEEDARTETKGPEKDTSTETKVPEEDASRGTKVPEEHSSTEIKVPEEDSSMGTKVPEIIIGSVDCQSISVGNAASEKHKGDDPVEKENAETEVENTAVVSSRDVACEGEFASESEAQNGSVHNPVQVENGEIQSTGEETDDKTHHQEEGIDGIDTDEAPTSTLDSSVTSSEAQNVVTEEVPVSEAQNVGTEVVKRPFYCLIKVPRFEDDNLKEQIKSFQLKVDEKTRSRDAIRDTIHLSRATFKESGVNLEALISEEKGAREMLKSKRQEIDSLQSVINKVKNAISVEDIDGRIRQMRHMIEHETLPLKEEKQLIREIEQLKQHREQFSYSMGKQDEIQLAFDQKDQIEERLKVLRKEADSLRENVSKAEAATQAARKKHKDLSEKLRELQSQFKAADDTRQESYKNLQSLRKQAYDKNKYFWKYKDYVKAANDLLSKGDKEALQNLCDNQVESVLEMWNNNDEFRKEYVKCNISSTIRRLKTLDGRSLGPNEEPPIIRPVIINRVTRAISASQIETVKEEKPAQAVPVQTEKENKSMANVGVEKVQAAKSQKPAKPAPLENGSATVSGRKEIEEAREEEPKRTKEEEELARMAEELRKKEEAAKLQEQRRLEEKVKAKEALERKNRIAEKAQARAAVRAQKEAEQKEKEREKRARKKEKKKFAAVEDTSVTNEEESTPSIETPTETATLSDGKDKSTTVTKKPQKPSHFTKQTKSKSVPLPLRNRGKRRMQSWMWVLIATLVFFVLFLLGNSSFSFKSGLHWFGF